MRYVVPLIGGEIFSPSLVLTGSFQYSGIISPFTPPGGAGGPTQGGIWQSVALYVVYSGTATGQCQIEVNWRMRIGPVTRSLPVVGPTIDLPVGASGNYVVSVDAPGGGAELADFGFREIGNPGTPGSVDVFIRGVRL